VRRTEVETEIVSAERALESRLARSRLDVALACTARGRGLYRQ